MRELVTELDIDGVEWSCDADLQCAFAKMKQTVDETALLLALLQRLRPHSDSNVTLRR